MSTRVIVSGKITAVFETDDGKRINYYVSTWEPFARNSDSEKKGVSMSYMVTAWKNAATDLVKKGTTVSVVGDLAIKDGDFVKTNKGAFIVDQRTLDILSFPSDDSSDSYNGHSSSTEVGTVDIEDIPF